MIHLKSWRNGEAQPILSGTSLAGVLRSRAYRIAKTLKGKETARCLVDGMFGKRLRDNGTLAIVRQISSVPQKQAPPTLSRVGFLFEPAEGFSLGEVGMFN